MLAKAEKFKQRIKEIEKCLNILGQSSGRYKITAWVYLIGLCRIGNIEKLNQQFTKLKSYFEKNNFSHLFAIILLFKQMQMGYIEDVVVSLKAFKDKTFFTGLEKDINLIEDYCKISTNQELEHTDELDINNWNLLAYLKLVQNDPKLSLYWVQKYADKTSNNKYESMIFSYSLLRSDLANRNVNVAKYPLNYKKNMITVPFLMTTFGSE